MATIQFTLESSPGSGTGDGVHSVQDTDTVKTDRGEFVATDVQVGWGIYTSPTMGAKVLSIVTV